MLKSAAPAALLGAMATAPAVLAQERSISLDAPSATQRFLGQLEISGFAVGSASWYSHIQLVPEFAGGRKPSEVSVSPGRAGANTIVLRFHDRGGLPFDPDELMVEIGNEAAGVEPAARPVRRVGPGHYSREGSELAFPGVWTIEVHARIASHMAVFRSQVPVR